MEQCKKRNIFTQKNIPLTFGDIFQLSVHTVYFFNSKKYIFSQAIITKTLKVKGFLGYLRQNEKRLKPP